MTKKNKILMHLKTTVISMKFDKKAQFLEIDKEIG